MRRSNERGVTLVELTITIVMTGIIASAMVVFVMTTLRTYASASAKADLMAQAQTAVGRIGDDILQSAVADVNNRIEDANSPDPSDTTGWVGDSDTLILASAVEDQSRNLMFSDASQYITHKNNIIYYLSGNKIYRRVLANSVAGNRAVTTCPPASATAGCPADTLMLERVTNFTVTYYNHLNAVVQPNESRSVEVSVSVQSPTYSAAKASYKTRTVFRND